MLLPACASQPRTEPHFECVPDVIISEKIVDIPAELTAARHAPPVDIENNGDLLDWAMQCGAQNRKANQQLNAIRNLP